MSIANTIRIASRAAAISIQAVTRKVVGGTVLALTCCAAPDVMKKHHKALFKIYDVLSKNNSQ